ncbi:hypothetical protein [Mycobacterium sp. 155]|uniref:hypothetical protein n=1 Tax=Mycobacterium sp. 155 TaxID=1157943 RepID=UPI00039BF36B|nr:hypothetical protein [Mycobacterium sp. 155]
MSRRFSDVGVGIAAARLREIATGAPVSDAELTDVEFAAYASEFKHDELLAKYGRAKRECIRALLVVAITLVVLGFLLAAAVCVLSVTLHTTPFNTGQMWQPVIPPLFEPPFESPGELPLS